MGMLQVSHLANTPWISAHSAGVSEAWEGCVRALETPGIFACCAQKTMHAP